MYFFGRLVAYLYSIAAETNDRRVLRADAVRRWRSRILRRSYVTKYLDSILLLLLLLKNICWRTFVLCRAVLRTMPLEDVIVVDLDRNRYDVVRKQ